MQTMLAVLFVAVILGQHQTGAADLGRRFGRQLVQENRIGDGAGNILDAVGANGAGNAVAQISDADDGDLTNDLAQTGQAGGQLMLDTLPTAGNAVPGRKLQQNAGTGAGCNAIFSDFDTSTGEGTENAENNVAGDINGAKPAGAGRRRLHQNAGTGAGCDAIFSDFDTSTGEGTENAENNDVGQLMLDTIPTAGNAVPGRKLQQNAGTGAGCNAIFSDFDTSTGEGTENAENNVAGDINGAKPAGAGRRRLHQNAGTGAGCDAIFSDFDTSTGEGTENAENNVAGDISGTKPAAGGGTGRKLLQENRIGDGAGNILDAVGANGAGNAVAQISDADDGDLTNDLANGGQDVGQLMLDTLPTAGNAVPGK
ncbi:hypothetical protein WJX73_003245 [Symbiochloris irregularis]|uniref:Uncharacterized protein n=1 Tax=Symbiochloris irregularis TaxID=706552 RepID=A0AAW1PZ13_9CHLO